MVVHSQALRTTQTWAHLADPLGGDPRVFGSWDLYSQGPGAYLRAVTEHAGQAATVMLVGHNPVVGELVESLTGERVSFGTAHAALLAACSTGTWLGWQLALGDPGRLALERVISG